MTEQEKQDMLTWSVAHGSPRLRQGLLSGYDCQGLYMRERCEREMPGWRPRRQSDRLDDRANPEEIELAATQKHGGTIRWSHGLKRAVLAIDIWGGTLIREIYPACGHSACSQHFIDTGDAACVHKEGT